jgi:hypothetical protein
MKILYPSNDNQMHLFWIETDLVMGGDEFESLVPYCRKLMREAPDRLQQKQVNNLIWLTHLLRADAWLKSNPKLTVVK